MFFPKIFEGKPKLLSDHALEAYRVEGEFGLLIEHIGRCELSGVFYKCGNAFLG